MLSVLLIEAVPGGLRAEPPWVNKTDLFEARTGGYRTYRIPGVVVTAKGVILAYCEARKFTGNDWDTIDVVLRRSTDGGKTWEPMRKISDIPGPKARSEVALAHHLGKPDDVTYNNPVAIADSKPGVVHFLFCLDYGRCFYMRSDDDGVTFGAPVEITGAFEKFRPQYDWHVLATGPGHGIQLKNGRLLVPVWLSTGKFGHHPSVAGTIFSDDNGKTWQAGDIAVPSTDEWVSPNETAVVQLADGRVMLNSRSESTANRRLITIGANGSTDWAKPRFDSALLEPICMASIVRLTAKPESDKNRLVFSNPDNLERADGKEKPGKSRDRKNLSIKLSYDEGETWPVNKALEPGASEYSDLAAMPDGTLLCFYSRKGMVTMAHFNLEWLTGGADSISGQPSK
ncbi:MAG TPA: sialidase family protein [Verrucomicrobiae bacterium]|jgi:sialidase-1|nr:sialidase family protein [Verrucomicrobiae bacterium]